MIIVGLLGVRRLLLVGINRSDLHNGSDSLEEARAEFPESRNQARQLHREIVTERLPHGSSTSNFGLYCFTKAAIPSTRSHALDIDLNTVNTRIRFRDSWPQPVQA